MLRLCFPLTLMSLIVMCPLVAADEHSTASNSPPAPADAEGSLVVCGGGSLPQRVLAQFVELAGGRDGRLVVIPTAGSGDVADRETELTRRWTERGLGEVSVLHTRDRKEADSAKFLEPLTKATAVWFGGGQQSRLAETYVGTAAEAAIVNVFRRGGVVGGTSAGAAIQSRVMIQSGTPVPKIATGLDLVPDAIIDQHFLRRNRFNRLLFAINKHPRRSGIGIDEATAVIYHDGECRVLGDSYVILVRAPQGPSSLSVQTFHAGRSFRLREASRK